ncbi:probable G-protein coupled receptor 21 [Rhopalosiphum maidis]|uniref:probable G-protein coupled receptor 21 n=1 Tax=Rhopalosiphum maidis TaxID=43146 RepID=UPI000F00450A|nr:probable G-protein coupled receptor 21 [Rhopalosiphum maidis]XP_026813356.1 probable G-protein coupled receptor 21 [Rhopalosiphum maidis]
MNGDLELVTVLAVCGVAALATFINGYVLLVILLSKRTSSPINVLLTHLSAVDLIVCISVLVSILPETFNQYEKVAPWLCPVHGFLFNFLHPMAIWTVCGLNCDRYYAIAAPLHYGTLVNSRKIMLGLCGTWIVCLLISLPPVFRLVPYSYQPGLPVCTTDFSKGRATIFYSIFYTTITLVLPCVIILGCNIKVFTIARYHRHRIASAIFEVTLSAQVTITHQRNPFFLPTAMANKLRRSNAFSAVFQIVGSLAVFYLPYYCVCLYESLCAAVGAPPRTDPAVKSLSFALITGSALCNGLLYGIKNKLLKKTYQNYRRKMMTKCEVNQEIQARTPSACGSRRPSLTPVAAAAGHGKTAVAQTGSATAATPLLLLCSRRSSLMSLSETGEPPAPVRRLPGATCSANALDFGNFYADVRFNDGAGSGGGGGGVGGGSSIRRCYSSTTNDGGPDRGSRCAVANRSAFVRRILRDSRRSPRILITRAMSEESEPYASEQSSGGGAAVCGRNDRRVGGHKLSSSAVTLFIDDCRPGSGRVHCPDVDFNFDDDDCIGGGGGVGGCDDDDEDTSLAYYSSPSSSNDGSGCAPNDGLARFTRLSA